MEVLKQAVSDDRKFKIIWSNCHGIFRNEDAPTNKRKSCWKLYMGVFNIFSKISKIKIFWKYLISNGHKLWLFSQILIEGDQPLINSVKPANNMGWSSLISRNWGNWSTPRHFHVMPLILVGPRANLNQSEHRILGREIWINQSGQRIIGGGTWIGQSEHKTPSVIIFLLQQSFVRWQFHDNSDLRW